MIISVRQTISFVAAMVALILLAQVASAAKLQKVSTTKVAKTASSKAAAPATSPASKTDRTLMREARAAFEKKDFSKALSLYEQIPQKSDYWTEALEERAWSHVHLKEHDQALANLKTLFAPPIKYEIGAEPYLLSTLVQLRLCNYDEIFKTMKRFKDDIRPRFEAMQTLAKTGESEASVKMLGRSVEAKEMSRSTAGSDLPNLPHLFYRDTKLQAAFKDLLAAKGDTAKYDRAIVGRMKALAQRDVKETEAILRKLHLVEVESTSRIFAEKNLADGKKSSMPIKRDANTLVFPDDKDDVWLDELDSYRVNAKGCPAPGKGQS